MNRTAWLDRPVRNVTVRRTKTKARSHCGHAPKCCGQAAKHCGHAPR